jgi:DNA-binding NtrC family response regulator
VKGKRILVVEDDPAAAAYLALTLGEEGYDVRVAGNGVEALLALESELPHLVVSDLRMPEMDGLALLSRVKQRWPELPFVLLTVDQDVGTVVEAVQLGAANYLVKPVSPQPLLVAVRKALTLTSVAPMSDAKLPEIVGRSKAIVEVRHRVVLAARSDVNVLIMGETGTGKELVARAIHRLSKLAKSPLVAQNCAAIPQELFESQFFGHQRGAFTGADRDHVGLLGQADGGVLFLDELESLSPLQQAKLLRVIDDGEVRPLGATASRRVSVRFLAATNRDPKKMLAARELREDLYHRLCGFAIHLPPLRERLEDLPLLLDHFLRPSGRAVTPGALAWLRGRDWPGNVRELRNLMSAVLALAGEGPIDAATLRFHGGVRGAPGVAGEGGDVPGIEIQSLREAERLAIARAIEASGGNRSRAARLLGIDRSTLRRKIREFRVGG